MGTSRCWQEDIVKGFNQRRFRTSVADRKKAKRMMVRTIVKKLKAAGKPIDLQKINHEAVNMFRRRKQGTKKRHAVLAIK
ncbi:MAG: hypothetical protein KJ584_00555 [Candidatus Omnitrophica bacterium]|nr:hypothetical protein [Candidatus Omnitrophota bacterium]MBU1808105.1 hypothetical protein [Candidatus Omnitrophota bacterium]